MEDSRKMRLYKTVLLEAKEKFPGVNWVRADGKARLKGNGMPKRVMTLRTIEKHLNQPVSPGKTPRAQVAPVRRGQVPLMPKEVTDLVKATSNLSQVACKTGGTHVRDVMAQFRNAIKGSPYEQHFDTADKIRTAWKTWRNTEGADLCLGLPTSNSKSDVVRHRWQRATTLIVHRL